MPKYDEGKLRYSLIEPQFLKELAAVLNDGAQKYGPENWKTIENAKQRYYDALMRHLEAWRGGEIFDEESGHFHMGHIAANAMFLYYFDNKSLDSLLEDMLHAQSVSAEGQCDMGVADSSFERDARVKPDHEERPRFEIWVL